MWRLQLQRRRIADRSMQRRVRKVLARAFSSWLEVVSYGVRLRVCAASVRMHQEQRVRKAAWRGWGAQHVCERRRGKMMRQVQRRGRVAALIEVVDGWKRRAEQACWRRRVGDSMAQRWRRVYLGSWLQRWQEQREREQRVAEKMEAAARRRERTRVAVALRCLAARAASRVWMQSAQHTAVRWCGRRGLRRSVCVWRDVAAGRKMLADKVRVWWERMEMRRSWREAAKVCNAWRGLVLVMGEQRQQAHVAAQVCVCLCVYVGVYVCMCIACGVQRRGVAGLACCW